MNESFPYFRHSTLTVASCLSDLWPEIRNWGEDALWTYTLQNLTKYRTFKFLKKFLSVKREISFFILREW